MIAVRLSDAERWEVEQAARKRETPLSTYILGTAMKVAHADLQACRPSQTLDRRERNVDSDWGRAGLPKETAARVPVLEPEPEPSAVHYVDGEPVPPSWGTA